MDYATMTDEELHFEIARLKGIKAFHLRETDRDWVYKPYDERGWHVTPLPDWSGDIRAAWELVEEMGNIEHVTLDYNGGLWTCDTDDYARTITAMAPTAPRAIAVAWLAWKRGAEA